MQDKKLIIRSPFEGHVHLRDEPLTGKVLPLTARQFVGGIVMPNLDPAVVTAKQVNDYRNRILAALPSEYSYFTPYMTTYLTEDSDPNDIRIGFQDKVFVAAKLYPAHATTNSSEGVAVIEKIYPVLEVMEEIGMVLCVHGEIPPKSGVGILHREAAFIDQKLLPILKRFPKLKVSMEHVTTREACQLIASAEHNLRGTVTPQHLLLFHDDIFDGGLRPDQYCLPVLKEDLHREEIQKMIISGNPRFGLGTDSAPHLNENKFKVCGCAGVFSAIAALEHYYDFFYKHNCTERFQAFASDNMASFYGLQLPDKKALIEYKENGWEIPKNYENITPLFGGQKMYWQARILQGDYYD